MTQYVTGICTSITNPEKLAEYGKVAGEALAKHGGAIVQGGRVPERLSGTVETPLRIVILSFPDAASARAWREDPELAEIHALRDAGAEMTFFSTSLEG